MSAATTKTIKTTSRRASYILCKSYILKIRETNAKRSNFIYLFDVIIIYYLAPIYIYIRIYVSIIWYSERNTFSKYLFL